MEHFQRVLFDYLLPLYISLAGRCWRRSRHHNFSSLICFFFFRCSVGWLAVICVCPFDCVFHILEKLSLRFNPVSIECLFETDHQKLLIHFYRIFTACSLCLLCLLLRSLPTPFRTALLNQFNTLFRQLLNANQSLTIVFINFEPNEKN